MDKKVNKLLDDFQKSFTEEILSLDTDTVVLSDDILNSIPAYDRLIDLYDENGEVLKKMYKIEKNVLNKNKIAKLEEDGNYYYIHTQKIYDSGGSMITSNYDEYLDNDDFFGTPGEKIHQRMIHKALNILQCTTDEYF